MFLAVSSLASYNYCCSKYSGEQTAGAAMVKIKQSVKQGQQDYFKNLKFDAY
jgi:hypothetical protein